MIEPRLPDPTMPKPETQHIGSEHAQLRDQFTSKLRELTDLGNYTEVVHKVPSDLLREIGAMAAVFAHDHEILEGSSKIDMKSGVINADTAKFELEKNINDRIHQVRRSPELYAVPFLYETYIDADNFKDINRVLTNPVVDHIIVRAMGRSLNQSMSRDQGRARLTDTVSKHGGDEFVMSFVDLFGDPDMSQSTLQLNFDKAFNAAKKLHVDVNSAVRDPNSGITPAQLSEIGDVTFSCGFTWLSLADIEAAQKELNVPGSEAVLALATRQQQAAKVDRGITTIAASGVVYDIHGNQLN